MDNSYCCVPQCNSHGCTLPRTSFHRFPSTTESGVTRLQWIARIKIGKEVTERMVVCGKHFKPTDFLPPTACAVRGLKRTTLKRHAVPSLNLPTLPEYTDENVTNAKLKTKKSKRPSKGNISSYSRTPMYGTPLHSSSTGSTSSRTPMYGSQTPQHEEIENNRNRNRLQSSVIDSKSGTQTPSHENSDLGAWDSTVANTPAPSFAKIKEKPPKVEDNVSQLSILKEFSHKIRKDAADNVFLKLKENCDQPDQSMQKDLVEEFGGKTIDEIYKHLVKKFGEETADEIKCVLLRNAKRHVSRESVKQQAKIEELELQIEKIGLRQKIKKTEILKNHVTQNLIKERDLDEELNKEKQITNSLLKCRRK